ncbi:hypothetical protein [Nereida sp. MMG025]|uniref:hypothetical protein n=1 Tax=Nereida sp. MMG025 TaxID=2909981 RepID=UPI001F2852FD|nr:hypothetical protein [Nereida sp. MMG025]MCF6444311.1 hypothetical protein [Nereida sp. MMG025]
MSIEYSDELKLSHRMIKIAGAAFFAFVGIVLTHVAGVFGHEARELVSSIFAGDLTRFVDFAVYLVFFFCVVVLPIIVAIASLYTALLSPNHVTKIDADRRMVTCDFDLPWGKPYRRSYDFDELCIKLIYDSEYPGSSIKLSLPDRWVALTLILEPSMRVAEQKFRRLVEIGLPHK